MKKNRYKLIALDMDGTLLMPDKSVHPDTIRDIGEADGRGIHVVYCSGRAVAELLPYVDRLRVMRYAVCMSGALVYDFQERRSIFSRGVPRELVMEIVRAAKEDDGMLHFLTEDASIVRKDQLTHMADYNMGVYQDSFLRVVRPAEDMEKEALCHDVIPKVNIYFHSVEARRKGYEMLKELPLTFAFAEGSSLEMTAPGVTKASGLRKLTEHLGISMEETIGIGDADNDRAALEAVGFSVAMGNAEESIKQLCDAVTADNLNNGVGRAIRKYCL